MSPATILGERRKAPSVSPLGRGRADGGRRRNARHLLGERHVQRTVAVERNRV